MAVATAKRSRVPAKWRQIINRLPGFDPFRQSKDCWFDCHAADRAIRFIETCCVHVEGELKSQPFLLELWQKAFVANLFGWKTVDSYGRTVRRFRKALLYVPGKNGKTPLVAAIANYVFFCDDEQGQDDMLAASSIPQAGRLYSQITGMIDAEPRMRTRAKHNDSYKSIQYAEHSNVMRVVSPESKGKHGPSLHFAAIDELHEQPDRDFYDVTETRFASKNRAQPLFLLMTTADYDHPSICNTVLAEAKAVRDNPGDPLRPGWDPSFLPAIWETDPKADWKDEKVWRAANPNLDISVSIDYLRRACRKAQEDPGFEAIFRRVNLNQRTQAFEKVIPLEKWRDCCGVLPSEADRAAMPCWVGIDAAATNDIFAMTILFGHDDAEQVKLRVPLSQAGAEQVTPSADDKTTAEIEILRRSYTWKSWYWIPKDFRRRSAATMRLLEEFVKAGLITETPGDVVDYDVVLAQILQILKPLNIVALAVDRGYQGISISQALQKCVGADRVYAEPFVLRTMAGPFSEFLALVESRRFHHDGNAVTNWMMGNVVAEHRGSLMMPSKAKSAEKIDGVAAGILALAAAIAKPPPVVTKSVYEDPNWEPTTFG